MADLLFDELKSGAPKKIEIDGTPVCVVRVGEEVFAIADTCSHSDASLSEGDVTEFKIECWLHGAEFDLRSGAALTPPATQTLETFAVKKTGNSVTITKKNGEK
jgi:3-phenylpropionate/trans-cinnamate dioxygenase ferredoxin subunit